jgi:hypothetical protein
VTENDAHPALITGASSGIGAAFARRLARRGHALVLVARRRQRLEALAEKLTADHGVAVEVLAADLADDEGLARVEDAVGRTGGLEVLVNNAGFGTRGHFVDMEPARAEVQARLHVVAPLRLTRRALPAMVARGRGAVVNVSSLAAFFTKSHFVTYSASKAYLNMFTEGLAAELAGTGVQAQVLCPGLTRTEFMDPAEFRDCDLTRAPEPAWMQPEEVVEASLSALARGGGPVVVPGRANRLFVGLMNTPAVGRLLRAALDRTGMNF